VVATLGLSRHARYPASRHVGSILLTGPGGEIVPLDYHRETAVGTDAHGNLTTIRLSLPAGTSVPGAVRAYAILDVFPLAARNLQ
jgi:hypothetical protein